MLTSLGNEILTYLKPKVWIFNIKNLYFKVCFNPRKIDCFVRFGQKFLMSKAQLSLATLNLLNTIFGWFQLIHNFGLDNINQFQQRCLDLGFQNTKTLQQMKMTSKMVKMKLMTTTWMILLCTSVMLVPILAKSFNF